MRRNDAWLWYLLSSSNDDPSPHRHRVPSPKRRPGCATPGHIFGRLIIYAVLIACAIELLDS